MIEVKRPEYLNKFVDLLTERCNQLDVFCFSRGYKEWDLTDFIRKASRKYALNVLDKIEHNLAKQHHKQERLV